VKVDSDVPIKVTNGRRRVEGLENERSVQKKNASLEASPSRDSPAPNANSKLLENPTEKLKIRKLHRINANIFAQLHNDELWLGPARRKHVPIPLRRQDVRSRLGSAVRRVDPRGAV